MKTQIANLINGEKRTIRNESASKYQTATPASSHAGYAGSSREERLQVADRVLAENSGVMTIRFCGHTYGLKKTSSASGKSTWYSAEITPEAYLSLIRADRMPYKHEVSLKLTVNGDMTVEIHIFTRRSTTSQWKLRDIVPVGEEYIEII